MVSCRVWGGDRAHCALAAAQAAEMEGARRGHGPMMMVSLRRFNARPHTPRLSVCGMQTTAPQEQSPHTINSWSPSESARCSAREQPHNH